MPYNIDGTYSMDAYGTSPASYDPPSADFFGSLPRRQEQSAPLAVGSPDLMGIVRQQAANPPQQVADVRPSMAEAKADPLAALAASGAPVRLDSGPSLPGAGPRTTAAPVAPSAAPAAPGKIVFAGGGGGAPADAAAPGTAAYANDAAEMNRRAALWELEHANRGGGGGPKPGTSYQTAQDIKTKTEGGVDPSRVAAYSEQVREQGLADINLSEAQRKHEQFVEGAMVDARAEQQRLDDDLAQRRHAALGSLQAQREYLDQEVGKTKIDPNRFWSKRSEGDRIGFILASALTGALGGFGGTRGNVLLDSVDKMVDKDIDAQVRNLETKKGRVGELGRIYQQAKEYWGDETVARAHAKAAALLETEKTVRKLATETGSAVAQAQSEKMLADLAARQEKLWFDSAGKVTDEVEKKFKFVGPGGGGGGGKNPYAKAAEYLGKAGQEQAAGAKFSAGEGKDAQQEGIFNGERVSLGSVDKTEGAKLRSGLAVLDLGRQQIAELQKIRQSASERILPSSAQIALTNRIAASLSKAQDMGVLMGNEREEMQKILTNWRSGDEALKSADSFLFEAGKRSYMGAGGKPLGPLK